MPTYIPTNGVLESKFQSPRGTTQGKKMRRSKRTEKEGWDAECFKEMTEEEQLTLAKRKGKEGVHYRRCL